VSNGNLTESELDYSGSGQNILQFVRNYNYLGADVGTAAPLNGATGQGWTHTYERRLGVFAKGAVRAGRPDGTDRIFLPIAGGYQEFGTSLDRLTALPNGAGWAFIDGNDTTETYNSSGYLQSITYRGGQTVTLTYSTASTSTLIAPSPSLLIAVADAFGHQLSFTYSAQGLMATMTDPSGGVYIYTNASGQLTRVSYPDSSSRQYIYNESVNTQGANLPYALTGIVDEVGTRYATFGFNAAGQAISSQQAGGVNHYTIQSVANAPGQSSNIAAITDPLGATRHYTYTNVGGVGKFWLLDTLCLNCSDAPIYVGYDGNGNVSLKVDFKGDITSFNFDLVRNLETSRTEALGTPQERTITTQWNSLWREPSLITEPNRAKSFTYDGNGNPLTTTITDTTVTPNLSRTWTYTYDSYGRLLTADGPRTDVQDVTTFAYYNCSSGPQCGQLQTVSDALGHVSTFNSYNSNGQPVAITDPNGVVTTLAYDARRRMTSQQVGSEITSYSYWSNGLLKQVTSPDGSTILYGYDGAHRLTDITDTLGNHIHYTLDALGNRTAVNTYDPTNALHSTHTRVFNALSELYMDINAAGTPGVTTTYGYDTQGNLISIAAPLGRNTTKSYDALNRLSQVIDPANGNETPIYDANNNVAAVQDPKGLTTAYSHNGFDDLLQQMSPDSGTTIYTYDSAGNLTTKQDARNSIGTFTYDALNRLTKQAYSDEIINFSYDAGTNGMGRLTGASDSSHALAWTYDAHGRVIGKAQTVGSVTKSVGYGYTNADLTSIVTPSGQTITYGYTNHRITSITINGKSLLTGVTYEPFGSVNAWTWGNSTTVGRIYSTDEKVTQISTAGDVIKFGYDNALRLTSVADKEVSANSWTADYDVLDRVTSASTTGTNYGWTYDANGNRLTQSGSNATTFNPASSSNRLMSTTGALARTYSYDAAGNTASYASDSFAFNQLGRMTGATASGASTNYLYSALGQMIKKSAASGTTLLMYDEAGHLLGEYSSSGSLIEETVWMGDIPVATLRPSGSAILIYYVHSDQYGSPRAVTLPSNNALTWLWSANPYGVDTPNQNPQGLGTFIYNMRFPGQYYQAETGLNYNYARDYDSATGRYLESDPIGLSGGINTYAYAGGDPVSNTDPLGLFLIVVGNTVPEQTALQNALNIVGGTERGYELIQALQNSPDIYVLTNAQNGNAYYLNHVISVDPNFHPEINVGTDSYCARQKAPTSIVLGHELGHAVRGDLPRHPENEWPNILENENPIRLQLGLPIRTSYSNH
jgi:RHS repeat-associated protein